MINDSEWKGYTLEELRFQKVLTLAKLEIQKSMLMGQTGAVSEPNGKAGKIWNRMSGALNYFDYAVLAYRIGSKIFSIFRKRR